MQILPTSTIRNVWRTLTKGEYAYSFWGLKGWYPPIQRHFCGFTTMQKKVGLNKGCWTTRGKLRVKFYAFFRDN